MMVRYLLQCSRHSNASHWTAGPYDYLRQISDAFTNAGAKASFFFNGNNWDCIYNSKRVNDIKYAYAAGHMIASHTWSHPHLTQLKQQAQVQDEMYRMEEALSKILGVLPAFMRPPYGEFNNNIEQIAAQRGQTLALWDWDTGDADGNSTAASEKLYRQIVNEHANNAVVLEHETIRMSFHPPSWLRPPNDSFTIFIVESTANTLVPYAINLFQSNGYNVCLFPSFALKSDSELRAL
jgi:peptidoglycan/xylan/chitin deacetylase (PgdA/CDA1 family)